MAHDLSLILTLTGGLTSALVLGLLAQKLRLSPIIGYLLAGVIVGPFTPGYVADSHIAEQLAELGVILLMFGVGLHFHLKDLLAVRQVAIPGALLQIAAATGLGMLVTGAFGWPTFAGVCSASRSRSRAPSSCCACCLTTISCTPDRGTSRSGG